MIGFNSDDLCGPWVVDAASDDRNVVGIADAHGNPICDMWHGLDGWTAPTKCTTKEWKLDRARLISAAPDLLAAIQNLMDVYSVEDRQMCCDGRECGCMGYSIHQEAEFYAKKAIEKATGSPA